MYEQLSIFDLTLPEFRIDKPIRLIELFAGIGSQAMALRDLGADFEHYRMVEYDKFAVASYNAIHGTGFSAADIRDLDGRALGICDTDRFCYIMTYSFPCQDLSLAGQQKGMKKGSGTRSGLLWEVERLLRECDRLPQVLLMENVPQVHAKANMPDFQEWIGFLESKGYSNYWQDLNARNYGIAQNRNRCFMVSILGKWNYRFPQPAPLRKTIADYLEDTVDEKYYVKSEKAGQLVRQLADMGKLGGSAKTPVSLSIAHPEKIETANCITQKNRGISNRKQEGNGVLERQKEILGSIYFKQRPDFQRGICPIARAVKAEQHDLAVVEVEERRLGMRGRNPDNPSDRTTGSPTEQRLEPNSQGICNTLTSVQKDNMVLSAQQRTAAGYQIRRLTPLECWRLMGFSDADFRKAEAANSDTQRKGCAGGSFWADGAGKEC